MMLSIEKPELCQEILAFPGGIHCIRLSGESTPRIILKLPANYLLPMKVNKGFKIYAVPVDVSGNSSVGLMCAFFEDADSPLVCWRLLDSSDETRVLLHALTKHEVLVHLFDDQNRELLGYRAKIDLPLMAKVRLEHARFPDFTHESFHVAHEQATAWFGLRNVQDDDEAIQFTFTESLFPEDLVVLDMRHELYKFHGSQGFGFTSLEREDPGRYQEMDIINLLHRVFSPEQIYHAPKRHYDQEEIADVIVIADTACLIVQAKDAPNTEKTLNRTLERKRLASTHMLKGALKQLSGAVKYIDRNRPLRMLVDDQEISIDIGNRNVLSLAVVRELFIDMYEEYSQELFGFFNDIHLPCIALDYAELHSYTSFCQDEGSFLGAYFQVFDNARTLGSFPRLRFGVNDVKNLLRDQDPSRA
ncbi:hypothetical protein ACIU0H_30880 [Pseudomonas aeruginosa]